MASETRHCGRLPLRHMIAALAAAGFVAIANGNASAATGGDGPSGPQPPAADGSFQIAQVRFGKAIDDLGNALDDLGNIGNGLRKVDPAAAPDLTKPLRNGLGDAANAARKPIIYESLPANASQRLLSALSKTTPPPALEALPKYTLRKFASAADDAGGAALTAVKQIRRLPSAEEITNAAAKPAEKPSFFIRNRDKIVKGTFLLSAFGLTIATPLTVGDMAAAGVFDPQQ